AEGVVAAVDVDELAGDGAGKIGKEVEAGVGDRTGIAHVPAERGLLGPDAGDLVETLDAAGGHRLDRTGRNEVAANAPLAEIAGDIAADRFESGLGNPHPVVHRPGDTGIEVEADNRTATIGGEQ